MQIKRYEAASIREALALVKSDLGPEAIILSTKRLMDGTEDPVVEVMAARDERGHTDGAAPVHQRADAGRAASDLMDNSDVPAIDGSIHDLLRTEMINLKSFIADASIDRCIQRDMSELRGMMEAFFDMVGMRKRAGDMEHLTRIYQDLTAAGISKHRACALLEEMKRGYDPQHLQTYECALKTMEDIVRKSVESKKRAMQPRRIKALIGPTGVGKTTTLAKLAAHYAIEKKQSVGLITTDTYRIAATEQLRVYAKIMDLPLEVAPDRDIFRQALSRFSGKDVVLVDTPGRSRNDRESMKKLRDTMKIGEPVEINLLLSLTSSGENLMDAADIYRMFDYDHMILTKGDECDQFGIIYDVIEQAGKPVLYMTNGQNVPQDIQKMNSGRIARMIMRTAALQ